MEAFPKGAVKGSLAVKSAFHTEIKNTIICGFQAINSIIYPGIVEVLAEISVEGIGK